MDLDFTPKSFGLIFNARGNKIYDVIPNMPETALLLSIVQGFESVDDIDRGSHMEKRCTPEEYILFLMHYILVKQYLETVKKDVSLLFKEYTLDQLKSHPLMCVKVVRDVTGFDLRKSKDTFDNYLSKLDQNETT